MINTASTTTYVAYQLPGVFVSEEFAKPVSIRNPQQHANDAPDNAFAFFYFDVVTSIVDAEGERIETKSGRRNISKTYYIDAELLTSEQVAALPGDHSSLLGNMRRRGLDPIVRCRTGNFQPYEPATHELLTTS